MSRQSPIGFVFSMVVEIAAVALIVSLLPRVDLRPAAVATNAVSDPAISHVGWTMPQSIAANPPSRETSYYERRSPQAAPVSSPPSQPALTLPRREPPPLIEVDPARTGYVEQRLDRASQQLVNSVGSAVAQAAGDWLPPPPNTLSPSMQPSGPISPASQAVLPPAPTYNRAPVPNPRAIARDPRGGSFQTQPRPWIRY